MNETCTNNITSPFLPSITRPTQCNVLYMHIEHNIAVRLGNLMFMYASVYGISMRLHRYVLFTSGRHQQDIIKYGHLTPLYTYFHISYDIQHELSDDVHVYRRFHLVSASIASYKY